MLSTDGASVAEYRALSAGLEQARCLGLDKVEVRCDARLVDELCEAVRVTSERIGSVVFTWVPAAANRQAHALVSEALVPPQ